MIAVIGDLMLDIFLLSPLHQAEQESGLLLRGGGSAANTAAWLAATSEPVTFVGCVGADLVGEGLVRELQAQGMNVAVRQVAGAETGAVVVEVDDSAERVMRSSRGANSLLTPADVQAVEVKDLGLVHLTGYSLLGDAGFEILAAAGRLAATNDALLTFDPSSVGVIRSLGSREMIRAIETAGVDLVLPNTAEVAELAQLTDVGAAVAAIAGRFSEVVVKDGAAGALYYSGGAVKRIPAPRASPVDTTGAGDAFNAGVIRTLANGGNPHQAAEMGVSLAARAVAKFGGRPD
jgi:sugar/nucleoside kinase (ribokinase family)